MWGGRKRDGGEGRDCWRDWGCGSKGFFALRRGGWVVIAMEVLKCVDRVGGQGELRVYMRGNMRYGYEDIVGSVQIKFDEWVIYFLLSYQD